MMMMIDSHGDHASSILRYNSVDAAAEPRIAMVQQPAQTRQPGTRSTAAQGFRTAKKHEYAAENPGTASKHQG